MKQPARILSLLLLAATTALWTGCATGARRIETGGAQAITTVGQINDADFKTAAEDALASLLASGRLEDARNRPAIVQVSRIQNRTGLQYDTDLLTKKIRVGISGSGKAAVVTDPADDPVGSGQSAENAFLSDKKMPARPDFTLSGKILKTQVRAGNLREATYTFQLSLQKPGALNVAVWEFERQITKQGSRASVGF